jgi:hypothetical protein
VEKASSWPMPAVGAPAAMASRRPSSVAQHMHHALAVLQRAGQRVAQQGLVLGL